MKVKLFRRIAVLALSVLLVFTCLTPAFAAGGQKAPVIIIPDMTEIRYYQNPNTVGDTDREVFNLYSENMSSVLLGIILGLATASENPAKGGAQIAYQINSLFNNIKMNEKGEPENKKVGVLTQGINRSVAGNEKEYIYSEDVKAFVDAASSRITAEEIFYFNYDWRLDPKVNGGLFKTFVDRVLYATGSKKVSVVARGYGGVVANAYSYFNLDHAKTHLASLVLLDTMVIGNSLIGDVMSGKLVRTAADAFRDLESIFEIGEVYKTLNGEKVADALVRYIGEDPAGLLGGVFKNILGESNYSYLFSTFFSKMVALIIQEQGFFRKVGSGYREILSSADTTIYQTGLRENLRNMPGLWAVVPEEEYPVARVFLFGKDAEIDPELLTKIENAHEVTSHTESTLLALQNAGVNLNAVAGYFRQLLPVTASLSEQSDGFQTTHLAGLGARAAEMDATIKTKLRCPNANHIHRDPESVVDASTSFLPENIWFIKYHKFVDYSHPTAAALVCWLVFSDSQRTVWEDEEHPQYMQASQIDNAITPLSHYKTGDEQNFPYGDLDFDGVVTAADARQALRYAVSLDKVSSRTVELVGDVDGSGAITAADARLILRFAVELETKFPVEQ